MSQTVKNWLLRIAGIASLAGMFLGMIDANETGPDDKAAEWAGYVSSATTAIANSQPVPLPPIGLFTASQLDEFEQQLRAARIGGQSPAPART